MNAYELHEAAFAPDQESSESVEYIAEYAEGAYEKPIFVTKEIAEKILQCHLDYKNNGDGSNDYYYMIEEPLSDIEL